MLMFQVSFFLFFFNCHFIPRNNIADQSRVAGARDSAHTAARGADEMWVYVLQEGARQEVFPRDSTSEPFSGAVWTLSSSSWRRITQDLVTTT